MTNAMFWNQNVIRSIGYKPALVQLEDFFGV